MATTVKFSATRCGRNEYHANKWKLSHSNGHFTEFFDKNCRCRRSLILKTFNLAIKFDAVRRMENCTKVILIWRKVRTITYHRQFSKVYKHYLQLLYTIITTGGCNNSHTLVIIWSLAVWEDPQPGSSEFKATFNPQVYIHTRMKREIASSRLTAVRVSTLSWGSWYHITDWQCTVLSILILFH